jgi:hypothetical protein
MNLGNRSCSALRAQTQEQFYSLLEPISKRLGSGAVMKLFVIVALAMLGAIPVFAQDQASCKAFFQVLRADAGTPGLRAGLDPRQKNWWDGNGQKKYPGLCLSGSVTSGDKPRYLVIWSNSNSIGEASLAPNEVFGVTASALRTTAPSARIYQPRWDKSSVTIVNVLYDGTLLLPPVYFQTDDGGPLDLPYVFRLHDSLRVLDAALKYLSQERVFLATKE